MADSTMGGNETDEQKITELDEDDHAAADMAESSHPSSSQAEGSGSSGRKKKGKKKKAVQALKNALSRNDSAPGTKAVVDAITQKVMEKQREQAGGSDEELNQARTRREVEEVMRRLKLADVLAGKSGLGGKHKKDMADHKFWATQPVPKHGEPIADEGPIEPDTPFEKIRKEPYPLPAGFVWDTIDIDDPTQNEEVYELLSGHYVEDDDATLRFAYSGQFINWALKPPGFERDWHAGVRVAGTRRLVAFISGVPITTRVNSSVLRLVEINFLCVHKKLRNKRMAPVLIKEITRRCHLKGIFQALYTVGVILPTPIATSRYWHRSLNPQRLVDANFAGIGRHGTMERMKRHYHLPKETSMPGLRRMEENDVEAVTLLNNAYSRRFQLAPILTEEEVRHYFISSNGSNGKEQVVWSYVVEDPGSSRISDYFAFYQLNSSVSGNDKVKMLNAAYLFYYASDCANFDSSHLRDSEADRSKLEKRLNELIGDALIIANNAEFDVFNALSLMDNNLFIPNLKFSGGDGMLHWYLFNYKCPPINGGLSNDPSSPSAKGSGIGLVML